MAEKKTTGIEQTDKMENNALAQNEEAIASSIHAYEGNDPFVFISYSHQNTDTVLGLLEQLGKSGLRYWYDDGIEWGSEWPQSIAEHLKRSTLLIAFHSKTSIKSQNCRQEIAYAIKHKKTILSVYLDDVVLPEGLDMQLSIYQALYAKAEKELAKCILENQYVKGCVDQEKYKRCLSEKTAEENTSKNKRRKSIGIRLFLAGSILLGCLLIFLFSMNTRNKRLAEQQKLEDQSKELQLQEKLMEEQLGKMEEMQRKISDVSSKLLMDLKEELKDNDLGILIDPETSCITFASSNLFEGDETVLSSKGKESLKWFLPKYFKVLSKPEYKDYIAEILIEEHTGTDDTYIENLKMSQARVLSVAEFCLEDEKNGLSKDEKEELTKILTFTGKGSGNPMYDSTGEIDNTLPRRIEFKIRMRDDFF